MAIQHSTSEERLRRILRDPKLGAYFTTTLTGVHYVLASGFHTDELYQMGAAFRFEPVRRFIADILISKLCETNLKDSIDVLVGVATGGLPLLYELQRDPLLMHTEAIWVDKETNPQKIRELKIRREKRFKKRIDPARSEFVLGRNFKIDPNKRLVIVEDVFTTGGSIQSAIDACSDYEDEYSSEAADDSFTEGNVVGIIVSVDRSPKHSKPLEVRSPTLTIISALRDPMNLYPSQDCPLCTAGVPLKTKKGM